MKGSGYGKLLLFGEHAAVHGYPAVGIALPLQVKTYIDEAPAKKEIHPASRPFDYEGFVVEGLLPKHHQLFTSLWRHIVCIMPELAQKKISSIAISSTVPYEAGFGSSGALSVSLATAILEMLDQPRNHERIWALANRFEELFHGTPSGIDTGLSTFGGCQAFANARPGGLPERHSLPLPPVSILYGTVPRQTSTRELVASVHRRLAEQRSSTESLLQELGRIASAAIETIKQTESGSMADRLGDLANKAQQALVELGLGSALLDRLGGLMPTLGACGYKLSGAGGGGAFYAIFPNNRQAINALPAVKEFLSNQAISDYHLHTLETPG